MKKLIPIFLIFFLASCGYTAVYKNQKELSFKISIENLSGDKSINKILKEKLRRYSYTDSSQIYLLNINSNFSKTVLSKNKTGRATNVNLAVNIQFNVKIEDDILNYSFQEKLNIENSSDIYEQGNYENSIKENFVSTIVEKLILELSILKWS